MGQPDLSLGELSFVSGSDLTSFFSVGRLKTIGVECVLCLQAVQFPLFTGNSSQVEELNLPLWITTASRSRQYFTKRDGSLL